MSQIDEMEQLLNMIYVYTDFRNPFNKHVSKKQLILSLKQFFKEKYQGIEKLGVYQSYFRRTFRKERTKRNSKSNEPQ